MEYAERASAIHEIFTELYRALEVGRAYPLADRMTLVVGAVETLNKVLYSYSVSGEIFDEMDRRVNGPYGKMQSTAESVDAMYRVVEEVTRECLAASDRWVQRYADD